MLSRLDRVHFTITVVKHVDQSRILDFAQPVIIGLGSFVIIRNNSFRIFHIRFRSTNHLLTDPLVFFQAVNLPEKVPKISEGFPHRKSRSSAVQSFHKMLSFLILALVHLSFHPLRPGGNPSRASTKLRWMKLMHTRRISASPTKEAFLWTSSKTATGGKSLFSVWFIYKVFWIKIQIYIHINIHTGNRGI